MLIIRLFSTVLLCGTYIQYASSMNKESDDHGNKSRIHLAAFDVADQNQGGANNGSPKMMRQLFPIKQKSALSSQTLPAKPVEKLQDSESNTLNIRGQNFENLTAEELAEIMKVIKPKVSKHFLYRSPFYELSRNILSKEKILDLVELKDTIEITNGAVILFSSTGLIGATIKLAQSANTIPNPLGLTHAALFFLADPNALLKSIEAKRDDYDPLKQLNSKFANQIIKEIRDVYTSDVRTNYDWTKAPRYRPFLLEADGAVGECCACILPHVHIRAFEPKVTKYSGSVLVRLLDKPLKMEFTDEFVMKYVGTSYTKIHNLGRLVASPIGKSVDETNRQIVAVKDDGVFCSELVAIAMIEAGLINPNFAAANVTPECLSVYAMNDDALSGKAKDEIAIKVIKNTMKNNSAIAVLQGKKDELPAVTPRAADNAKQAVPFSNAVNLSAKESRKSTMQAAKGQQIKVDSYAELKSMAIDVVEGTSDSTSVAAKGGGEAVVVQFESAVRDLPKAETVLYDISKTDETVASVEQVAKELPAVDKVSSAENVLNKVEGAEQEHTEEELFTLSKYPTQIQQ